MHPLKWVDTNSERSGSARRLLRTSAVRLAKMVVIALGMSAAGLLAASGAGAQAPSGEDPRGAVPPIDIVVCYAIADGAGAGQEDDMLFRVADVMGTPTMELVGSTAGATDVTAMVNTRDGILAWDQNLGLITINASTAGVSDGPFDVVGTDIQGLGDGGGFFSPALFAVDRSASGPDMVTEYETFPVEGRVGTVAELDLEPLGLSNSGLDTLANHPFFNYFVGLTGPSDDRSLIRVDVQNNVGIPTDFTPSLVGSTVDQLEVLSFGTNIDLADAFELLLFGITSSAGGTDLHRISPSQGRSLGVMDSLDLADGLDFQAMGCQPMRGNGGGTNFTATSSCPSTVNYSLLNDEAYADTYTITPGSRAPITVTLEPGEKYDGAIPGLLPGQSLEVRITQTSNSFGTTIIRVSVDCPVIESVGGGDAPIEVMHSTTCLARNGRVDTNIVNTGADAADYRLEFAGLSPRQLRVEAGDWWRMPITGRPDGDHDVTVFRNGSVVSQQTVTVDCDEGIPNLPDDEIRVVNACRGGAGYLLFQFVNGSQVPKPYVISVPGLPNRSTTAAEFGQSVRALTGRQNGVLPVTITSNGDVVADFSVNVNCA